MTQEAAKALVSDLHACKHPQVLSILLGGTGLAGQASAGLVQL